MNNDKWLKQDFYILLMQLIKSNLRTDENLGVNKSNFNKLPKVQIQGFNSELLDLSTINLSNLEFGKVWMGHYLENSDFSYSKFYSTHFHNAVANFTNFKKALFNRVQFIPFYSPNSNYEECEFNNCLGFGVGGNPNSYYSYNDFTNCNFKGVIIKDSDFSKSNFTHSNFENASIQDSKFEGAIFFKSNFKNTIFKNCSFSSLIYDGASDFITNFKFSNLNGTKFINCKLDGTIFDNNEDVRKIISSGDNINISKINYE